MISVIQLDRPARRNLARRQVPRHVVRAFQSQGLICLQIAKGNMSMTAALHDDQARELACDILEFVDGSTAL